MGFALSHLKPSSTAFTDGGPIPTRHTGDGDDLSPALSWSQAPAGSKAFAVICHDPDAPLISANGTYGFVHWVLYNIPGDVQQLDEDCDTYTQGRNNFDKDGYGGPMPPEGHGMHRYYFWVLALDDDSKLPAGLTLWQLLEKIEPHVIGMNRLVGHYER